MTSILVTGIGGVVGQGILRNIRKMDLSVYVIGTNTVKISGGNHLCDEVFQVPFAADADYIESIIRICKEKSINLIIPSTDYEAYYLSICLAAIPCIVAVSPGEVTKMCLDKLENYRKFKLARIPFAESYLPANYRNQFLKTIVKPREGRGSRNIFINPNHPASFSDEYIVQELLEGEEITTTFYVTQTGSLLGFITFSRELESGNTVRAEVCKKYDKELEQLINQMTAAFPFRGSVNVQSCVTRRGIIPFEVNCRISGTNSIRAEFGFNDVAFTVKDFLFHENLSKPDIREGSAVRIILDIIYPDKRLSEIDNRRDSFYIS